jgi:hypothetical protein
MLKVAILL